VQGVEAVYISTNAGATWTLSSPQNGGVIGSGIACSADGRVQTGLRRNEQSLVCLPNGIRESDGVGGEYLNVLRAQRVGLA
jgi:hypothetical protein